MANRSLDDCNLDALKFRQNDNERKYRMLGMCNKKFIFLSFFCNESQRYQTGQNRCTIVFSRTKKIQR